MPDDFAANGRTPPRPHRRLNASNQPFICRSKPLISFAASGQVVNDQHAWRDQILNLARPFDPVCRFPRILSRFADPLARCVKPPGADYGGAADDDMGGCGRRLAGRRYRGMRWRHHQQRRDQSAGNDEESQKASHTMGRFVGCGGHRHIDARRPRKVAAPRSHIARKTAPNPGDRDSCAGRCS